MNPAYLPLFSFWLIMFVMMSTKKRNNRTIIANRILNNELENQKMLELAKRFIEKECVIYTFDGNQYHGTVKEVTDGAMLIDKKGNTEAINLDFVVRIKEVRKK